MDTLKQIKEEYVKLIKYNKIDLDISLRLLDWWDHLLETAYNLWKTDTMINYINDELWTRQI